MLETGMRRDRHTDTGTWTGTGVWWDRVMKNEDTDVGQAFAGRPGWDTCMEEKGQERQGRCGTRTWTWETRTLTQGHWDWERIGGKGT